MLVTERVPLQSDGLARKFMRLGSAGLVVLALLWFGGLFAFVGKVKQMTASPDVRGEGIVVLTGGAERINAALILLERRQAQRLLITGVHPRIGPDDLSDVTIGSRQLFDCCIDLDKTARNTRGNASEAARWAAEHNYRRLIIVTANYHMPRTLIEFRAALPNAELIAYPIAPKDFILDKWWTHPGTTSLLASEYSKYLLVLAIHGAATGHA